MADALERKRNSRSRFKTIGTPEEHRRQVEQDLQRAYREDSPLARLPAIQPPAEAAAPSKPQALASPAPVPPPLERDVVAVPLVRLPNGLLGLDWSALRSDRGGGH